MKRITKRDFLIPLEKEILRMRKEGKTLKYISSLFDVSERTLRRFLETKIVKEKQ